MAWLEDITSAVASRDAFHASALMHDLQRAPLDFATLARPNVSAEWLPLAAAIVELLAERQGISPPRWIAEVGALDQPFYALAYALKLPRLREQCERESPPALRRRNVFAPMQFLTVA